jgi:hypothetical protein
MRVNSGVDGHRGRLYRQTDLVLGFCVRSERRVLLSVAVGP